MQSVVASALAAVSATPSPATPCESALAVGSRRAYSLRLLGTLSWSMSVREQHVFVY